MGYTRALGVLEGLYKGSGGLQELWRGSAGVLQGSGGFYRGFGGRVRTSSVIQKSRAFPEFLEVQNGNNIHSEL